MPDNLKVIEKDRWFPAYQGATTSAKIVCPDCGREFALLNRNIDAKGIVLGAVRCPWNRKQHPEYKEQMDRDEAIDCDFHSEVRLEGWPPPGRTTAPPEFA